MNDRCDKYPESAQGGEKLPRKLAILEMPLSFLLGCVVILLLQMVVWTEGGAGTTITNASYPEGYVYIADDPNGNRIKINKEDMRYISQYWHFLNCKETFPRTTQWPALRSSYAFLASGFWFLGYQSAGRAINLIFWMLAIVAAAEIPRLFASDNKYLQMASVVLVLFHQGILWGVGAFSVYTVSYSCPIILMGAIAYWQGHKNICPFRHKMFIVAIAGLFTLFYHTSIYYIPLALILLCKVNITNIIYAIKKRQYKEITPEVVQIMVLAVIAGLPYLSFRQLLVSTNMMTQKGSTLGVILTYISRTAERHGIAAFTSRILNKLWNPFACFGPFVIIPGVIGFISFLRLKSSATMKIICIYFVLIFIFLYPVAVVGSAGYAAIHLYPFMLIFAIKGLHLCWLWLRKFGKVAVYSTVVTFVVMMAIYVNLPRFGILWPYWVAWDFRRVHITQSKPFKIHKF